MRVHSFSKIYTTNLSSDNSSIKKIKPSPGRAAKLAKCGSHREPLCRLPLWPCSVRQIAGDTVAYIQGKRNAVGGAVLRHTLSTARLHRLFWFAWRRAEVLVSRREIRPLTEHTAQWHAQRASYKNIWVSPSMADGCYHGDRVTNRECVRARLHQWVRKPGGVQSVTTAAVFTGSSWLSLSSSLLQWLWAYRNICYHSTKLWSDEITSKSKSVF